MTDKEYLESIWNVVTANLEVAKKDAKKRAYGSKRSTVLSVISRLTKLKLETERRLNEATK